MKNYIKPTLLHFILLIICFPLLWVVYAAWNDDVSTGDPLTADNWNNLISHVEWISTWSGKFISGTNTSDAVFTGGNVGIGTNDPEYMFSLEGTYGWWGTVMSQDSMIVNNAVNNNDYYYWNISKLQTAENHSNNVRWLVSKQNVVTRNGDGSVFYGSAAQNLTYVNDDSFWRYLSGVSSYVFFNDTSSNQWISGFNAPIYFNDNSSSTIWVSWFNTNISISDNASVDTAHGANLAITHNSSTALENSYGLKIGMSGTWEMTNVYWIYIWDVSSYGTSESYSIYSAWWDNYLGWNVWIGTTTPSKKLEVNGDVKIEGDLYLWNSATWICNAAKRWVVVIGWDDKFYGCNWVGWKQLDN